jgi:hypothetical protein
MSRPGVQFELAHKRVYVAGHTGMVGSAIVRRLGSESCEIVTPERRDLDLRRCEQVDRWMAEVKPDAVFLAAGRSVAYMPIVRIPQILLRTTSQLHSMSSAVLMRRGCRSCYSSVRPAFSRD